jgi:hypothetical protein
MFAIILKELRATAWVAALGAAAFVWFLSELCGVSGVTRGWFPTNEMSYQFTSPGWLLWWGFVSAGFAGSLGLVMSLNDGVRGMWAFVLFRPISRRRYIGAKLLAGSCLTVLMVGIPALVFLWWSATPGNLPMPFDWTFALPAFESIGWSVVVYLGGFLSGIRPASWWWSRLWPLGATVILGLWFWWLAALPTGLPSLLTPTMTQYWLLCGVMCAMLVTLILHVVDERDFA